MITHPPLYQVGSRVWITPSELEYPSFEALIIGVRYDYHWVGQSLLISDKANYTVVENPDEGHPMVSDGWTEDMMGLGRLR